jgi:peptidyl-prolyl cis-trans isomerase D
MEQARAFGIDRSVMATLINGAAVDEHARELNLGISDSAIATRIKAAREFRGADGQFNERQFQEILRNNNLSEQGFVQRQKQTEVRQQLSIAMLTGLAPPKPLLDAFHRFSGEVRTAEFLILDAAKTVTVPAPSEAAIKTHYDLTKKRFMTPEYRRLSLLVLDIVDVKKTITVSEADLKAAYEAQKASFGTPEKRRVMQLVFTDRAAADAASKLIKTGKTFVDVAKGLGRKEAEYDLGTIAQSSMLDKKLAAKAFALGKGKVSDPIAGSFATALLLVTDIQPGKQQTFAEVRKTLLDRLQSERAQPEVQALHDKIEDERGAGKSLKEIAGAMNIKHFAIAATARNAKGPDGKIAFTHPQSAAILRAAFEGSEGVEGEVIDLSDGGFAWVDVVAVTKPKQKPLSAVKADVTARLKSNSLKTGLQTFAAKAITRLKGGVTLETIAKEQGSAQKTTQPLSRTTSHPVLGRAGISQIFSLREGAFGSVATIDGKSRVLFKVLKVTPPPIATKTIKDRQIADLTRQMTDDVMVQYIASLEGKFGVTVNQAGLRTALGITEPQ